MKYLIDKYKFLMISECIIVGIIIILGVFAPRINHTYHPDELTNYIGEINDEGKLYVDSTMSDSMLLCSVPEFEATYGQYLMTIHYTSDSDNNFASFSLPDHSGDVVIAKDVSSMNNRDVVLRNRTDEVVCETFLNAPRKNISAFVAYAGEGSLTLESITIKRNPLSFIKPLLFVLILFGLIDWLIIIKNNLSSDKSDYENTVFAGAAVFAIAVFASIPLFVNYLIKGFDLNFHLLRIEGVKDSLLMGAWPVKIQPNWLCGNGYATSVFYGDVLLYIPALLRLCGFTIMEAYNIFVFLTNLATAVITYITIKNISKSRILGVLGSMVYTLSIYRLVDLYVRSSVGEYTALIFVPLLVYGMWKVYTDDSSEKKYSKNWIIPTIAFTGIIESHLLTTEMVGALTVIFCLINFKKTFKKNTFIVLFKIVIYTVLINLGFLIPLLDYMINGSYNVQTFTLLEAGIQQHGVFPAQILLPFAQVPGINMEMFDGINGESPYTTGTASIIGLFLLIVCTFIGYEKNKDRKRFNYITIGFSILLLWLSTCMFPWNALQRLHSSIRQVIVTIQFPWRFLGIASIFLAIATVCAMRIIRENKQSLFTPLVVMLSCLTLFQSGSFIYGILNEKEPYVVCSPEEIDNCDLIGSEYLPSDSEPIYFSARYYASELSEMTLLKRVGNELTFRIKNTSDSELSLFTALVKYPGYVAKDLNTKQYLPINNEAKTHVEVLIPAGYSGDIKIYFKHPTLWVIGYIVSGITICILALSCASKMPLRTHMRNK